MIVQKGLNRLGCLSCVEVMMRPSAVEVEVQAPAPTPTLPVDVIRSIIQRARLDIDTRLGLRVKPGRLTEEPSYGPVRERLRAMHARRREAWKRNEARRVRGDGSGHALEHIRSPPIATGPRSSMQVCIDVWGPDSLDCDVRMSIEALETVEDDPQDPLAHLLPPGGAQAFVRRGAYCRVPTGETCPPIFDDDDSY